jgi:ABC-2 type transport system ATP-binding protein
VTADTTTVPATSGSAGTSAQPVLVARDLAKAYGGRWALRSLSFSLSAGRVLGFLGPNGAGKTTSIRILTTVLEPTSGDFVVDGVSSSQPEQIRRRIGVLPEGLGFPRAISAIDYLKYYGQLFGRPAREAADVGFALLRQVGLESRTGSLIGTFSHGMRQRLGIARALVNDPRVVFLDEPTLGLDPRGQAELLALIQDLARSRGVGVVLSSHLLSEIERICDDVVIMNAGRIVATGTVADVVGRASEGGARARSIRIKVPPASTDQAAHALEGTSDVAVVAVVDRAGGWLSVEMAELGGSSTDGDGLARNRVLDALISAEVPILAVEQTAARLQDVFLELTAETIQ